MAVKQATFLIEGQTVSCTLSLNPETGCYEAVTTAPALSSYHKPGGTYGISLRLEDQAGNVTSADRTDAVFGEILKLGVYEKVPPVIVPLEPGAGAYLTDQTVEIRFDVTDNDSGVDVNTIRLRVDDEEILAESITVTEIPGGYRCSYTAIFADGGHSVKINAADYDGNAALQSASTFTVDTVPPALDISTPAAGFITNQQECIVAGITNDATSAPCTVLIRLNDSDQGTAEVAGDGSFAKTVFLGKGTNTIYVKSTDKAGKYSEITRTVLYDPDAPVLHSVEILPNPVEAGKPFKIIVNATD